MISIELIRHGHPEWIPGGMAVDEPELSDLGKIQAERAAERLAGKRFDQIFVSPLTRALQTARPICERLGIQAQVLPWLAELGHPPLAGASAEEVDAFFWQATLRPPEAWWAGLSGGESFRVFTERVQTGMTQLLAGFGLDHDLAVMVLACRFAEAVLGAASIPDTLGLSKFHSGCGCSSKAFPHPQGRTLRHLVAACRLLLLWNLMALTVALEDIEMVCCRHLTGGEL